MELTYPTHKEIEEAPLTQLSRWFVLLPNPQSQEQTTTLEKIKARVKELYTT